MGMLVPLSIINTTIYLQMKASLVKIILVIILVLMLIGIFVLFELFLILYPKAPNRKNEDFIYARFKKYFLNLFEKSILYLGGLMFLVFILILGLSYMIFPPNQHFLAEFRDLVISARPELIGAIFDLFLFFLLVEHIREKLRRDGSIKGIKTKLYGLKNCYDGFAKILVAQYVRELLTLGVSIDQIEFGYLHIGNLESQHLCYALQENSRFIEELSDGRMKNYEFKDIELKHANCKSSWFINIKFNTCSFVNVDFSGSKFIGCEFINSSFDDCNFTESGFYNDMIFENASFIRCTFLKTFFQRPVFDGVDLNGSEFISSGWTNASFRNTNLIFTRFTDCNLVRAQFDGARLAAWEAMNWFENIQTQSNLVDNNIENIYEMSSFQSLEVWPFSFVTINQIG